MAKPKQSETPPWPLRLVTLESGEPIIVNMETITWIRRHAHEPSTDHTHAEGASLVQLHLIAGGDVIALDDGGWWGL